MKIRKKLNLNQVRMNKNIKVKKADIHENVSISSDKFDKAEYNVLLYFAGDNNLQTFLDKNMLQLGKLGSDNYINFIALFDRGPRPTGGIGGWKNAKFFRVNKGKTLDEISKDGKVLNDGKEINMSDPKILTNFIKEASKRWPAKHTLLILNDHGGGFTGVISDDHPRGFMSMPEVKEALQKAGVKIDILAYDACLMAQIEVDYETRNVADIALHSEESEGANGWSYKEMFSYDLFNEIKSMLIDMKRKNKDLTPEAFAQKIVDVNRKHKKDIPTFSAVRLGKYIKRLADLRDEIGKQFLSLSHADRLLVKSMILGTQRFDKYGAYEDFRDLGDFIKKLANSKDIKNKELKKLAKEFLRVYDEAIIDEEHDKLHSGATGLSTYMPEKISSDNLSPTYSKLSISKDYRFWEKGLKYIMDTSFVIPH